MGEISGATEPFQAVSNTLEAARAGPYGRSFMVVASEVKKLAGQTSELTKSITELLEDLTTSVQQTTSSLGLFAEVRDEMTRKATEARENLVSEANIVEAIGGDDTELRDGAQGLSDVLRDTGLARGSS